MTSHDLAFRLAHALGALFAGGTIMVVSALTAIHDPAAIIGVHLGAALLILGLWAWPTRRQIVLEPIDNQGAP